VLAHWDCQEPPDMSSSAEIFSAAVGAGDDSVVALAGELDMATAPELAGVLDAMVEEGPLEVVLDFSGLSFIDSSGIAVLVAIQHRLNELGRTLSIRAARPAAVRVFEIAGLVDFLHVHVELIEEFPT
jgi:anti-sigma B factor antagonist